MAAYGRKICAFHAFNSFRLLALAGINQELPFKIAKNFWTQSVEKGAVNYGSEKSFQRNRQGFRFVIY